MVGALAGTAITLIAAVVFAGAVKAYSSSLISSHVFEVGVSGLTYVFFWTGLSVALTIKASLWNAPEWQVYLIGGLVSVLYNSTVLAIVFRVVGHFINKRKSVEHAVPE
jgi:hypothetical protein